MPSNLKHKFEYVLLRTVIFSINLLPVRGILWFAGSLGRLAWYVFPFRLNVAYENISNVFPKMKRSERMGILKTTYREFAKTFGIIFILHRRELVELIRNARISGREKVDAALQQGKGVVLTTYHGSWFEAYFAWFNLSGLPTSLIYQKQSNPLSDDFFVRQRKRYGDSLEHLHSQEGMQAFQEALTRNRLLIVSLDQSFYRGSKVKLFGKDIKCAKGAAVLHMRTGAPVLTSVYYMKDKQLHIDFDTVDLPAYREINEENIVDLTTRSLAMYESYIRAYPEQWFSLFHKLWKKKGYSKVRRSLREIFLAGS